MPRSLALPLSSAITALTILLSLTSCSTVSEPIVSGDTYCERAKFISATPDEKKAFTDNETLWRPIVKQVADHNDTYKDAHCIDATDPAK